MNPISSTKGETSEGKSAARETPSNTTARVNRYVAPAPLSVALHDGLQQIFPKAGGDHVVEAKQQDRQADERQDAGDGYRLHRRDPPPPHQHAEGGKETSGRNKQEIAADAVGAYGPKRFGADHREAENNDEGADDAPRRQRLFQHHARQRHSAQRRAGRLDDAAMAERNKQITKIAKQREREPAKNRERKAAAPSQAAKIAQASAWRGKEAVTSPGQT